MTRARAWLPSAALRDGALSAALAAHAANWAARWFGASKSTSVRASDVRARSALASDASSWSHEEEGFLLVMNPSAHIGIAHAMLGLQTGARRLSAQDRAVLKRLALPCAVDFASGAAACLGLAPAVRSVDARESEGALRFSFSLGDATQVFDLYVHEHIAAAARRALMSARSVAAAGLKARSQAIARQHIDVGVMLGSGRLDLGELRALAVGDVLVLDRGAGDAVELTVDGVALSDSPCTMVKDGQDLLVHINATETGLQA